uniref:Mucin-2-like n=1 Tax=Saccoglossus kowalevskii TaxID=10224 RepID=A0ABM0GMN9_SACKO|nr:PREDICTED: mucin-2-like [Saccoglossus kowalevskii]
MGAEPAQCNKDGTFIPQQTINNVTYCVDVWGTVLVHTITPMYPGTPVPSLKCQDFSAVDITPAYSSSSIENPAVEQRCLKQGHMTRDLNLWHLTCHNENGTFNPYQEYNSAAFCVDLKGVLIPGTMTPLTSTTKRPNCEIYRMVNLCTSAASLPMPKVLPSVTALTSFLPTGPEVNYVPGAPAETIDTTTTPTCIKMQEVAMAMGVKPPTCHANSTFTPLQCTSKVCYCIDTQGTIIPGTAAPITPYTKTLTLVCDKYWNVTIVNTTGTAVTMATTATHGITEKRDTICYSTMRTTTNMALPSMQCEAENGTFTPLQSTNNVYYCVDVQGRTIPGTVTPITKTTYIPNCEIFRNVNLTTTSAVPPIPVAIPVITPMSIPTSMGQRVVYTVPESTIKQTTVTTTAPIVVPIVENTNLRPCFRMHQILTMMNKDNKLPDCKPNGYFEPLQCDRYVCACLDVNNVIIPETITPTWNTPPTCSQYATVSVINTNDTTVVTKTNPLAALLPEGMNKITNFGPCTRHQHIMKKLGFRTSLTCLQNGTFSPLQQHNDLSWCVDRDGRTIPYTVNFNIEGSSPPNCEPFRGVSMNTTIIGSMILNPLVKPVVTEVSLMTPTGTEKIQAVVTTTIATDSTEIPDIFTIPEETFNITFNWDTPTKVVAVTIMTTNGTQTIYTLKQTTNSTSNATNPIIVPIVTNTSLSPCTHQKQIAKMLGVSGPLCETDNTFKPLQCYNSVCRCVDQKGVTIPGTITRLDTESFVREPECQQYKHLTLINTTVTNVTKTTRKIMTETMATAVGPCTRHQWIATTLGLKKMNCNAKSGTFSPVQCDDEVCYCVDHFGVTIPGTFHYTTAAQMTTVCEPYRNVNLNTTINNTVIFSSTLQPIVRNFTILTASGVTTMWAIPMTVYDGSDAVAANTTATYLLLNTPTGPQSVLTTKSLPANAVPTRNTTDNSNMTTDYTTTIQLPTGPVTIRVKTHASTNTTSYINYSLTIVDVGVTKPLELFTETKTAYPTQQFVVTPYETVHVNTEKLFDLSVSRFTDPKFGTFPFINTTHSQTVANENPGNNKLTPVTVITPNGPITVMMPDITPLTTLDTTKTTTDADTTVLPMTVMTPIGVKTIWTVVSTTASKIMDYIPVKPIIVSIVSNTTQPPCFHQTQVAKGLNAVEPTCESTGYFTPLQCIKGNCYCVDVNGVVIAETIIPTYVGVKPQCERYRTVSVLNTTHPNIIIKTKHIPHPWNMNIKKTFTEVSGPCKRHRIIANKLGLQSSLNCHEENGTFTPLQCPDTDTCYCVDSMGVTIPGTITSVSVNTPVPQCEQYRTLNMNTTSSGTLLLPPHVQPIVTNTTIMTPTGIRSVFTPVLTHMTTYNNLTNNFTLYANMTTNTTTQLPFNLPVNVTANATLNTPYTFPTNVTVMTPNGSKTVNVMVTVIITNATIMSSALSSTNVPYKPLNSPIPTAIRIPLIPTMTLSTPWGHRQWEDKLTTPVWTTPFASSPITSPFMNPWTTPFSTLTRTAPVTATDTCYSPVLYSLAIPSDISTTSEMKPWFMQYLVINYLNFTGPLDYSHTHVTGMIKDAVPYTGLTPYEPMTVFSLHASLPMNMIDTRISSNITATLTQKVRDTTTYPVTFMTPFGSMTRWMPVFSFTWYTNMTQSSVLPVVTPLTITTKTGLEVIYTAQPPAELKLSDTTPPMILPFVINTTQAPCTNLQHIAKLLGVIPPTCHEDGTFTTSQCTGQICYCVDSVGVLIASTVIAHRRPYCHPYKSVTLINTTITNITTEVTMSANHHPVTKAVGPCTRHQRIARSYGLTTMDCHAENGTFIPSQCVDSVCYCVDRNGVTVPGTPTVVTPYNPAPNCQLYRNVDLNLMYNGTIMLNPTTIPVVREVSVVTPSGPKTVWTPITTDMTPNTSDKLMTFQMTTRNTTTARQVTVMTAKGVQTIWANVPWTILPFTVHSSINTTTNTTNTNSTQTPACIRQTQIAHEVHGVVKPICSPITGEYEKLQYNPVTGTYYCVDINGVIIPNTVTPSILPEPSCELYGNVTLNVNATGNYTWANATGSTSCWQQRKSALATPGKFVPFCEPNGTFTPLQCNPNTGYCFCVDPAGHVVPKTVTHVTRGTPACWAFHGNVSNSTAARTSQRPANYWKTLCQTQQQLYQPIPGSFYPRCNANGGFSPVQCHDSAGYCYCVTKDGAPIPGSTTTIGIPDCSSYTSVPAPTTTSKDCHTAQSLYDRSSKIHAGAVRPWCEVEGTYSPIQCHVGLGYCFCVDPKTGAEIPGTETRGRPDCTPRITPKSPVEIVEKDYDCYDDKGKGYERGERLYRRCNKCWCRPGGEFVCTKKRCQSNVCYENGRRQKDGSTKRNDCNTCTCMGGAWVCTLKACTTNQERQTLAATTTTTTTTHTGTEQIAACPSGQTIEKCPYDPCEAMPICRSNPLAVCIPNDCAGCERVFYDLWGKQVKCQDWDE